MVLADPEEVEKHKDSGVLVEIRKPAEILLERFPERRDNTTKSITPILARPLATGAPTMQTRADENLSLDQMWIISSLVGQYLTPK